MRELSAQARLHFHARSLKRARNSVHLAVLCGAFALIAVALFGTLSAHPF